MRRIYFIPIILLILASCHSEKSNTKEINKENGVPVIYYVARTSDSNNELSLSGNVEAKKTVRLGFLVAGKIDFISANEGQSISKAQLIASIEPTSYSIAKELADIQVNAITDDYNRLKQLHDRRSLTDGDFAKIDFGLQQAKAQQKLHTKNFQDTKLYSPIAGVLLKKSCEVGEIISIGMPLFVVADISIIRVIAFIPESELHSISLGQKGQVFVPALKKSFEGKVVEIGSAADATSRAFTLKLEVENKNLLIRPGMIAEVSLTSSLAKRTLSLPIEAVLHDLNNESYIYVIDSVQSKAFKRKVSLGNLENNQISIVAGLNEHEKVVLGGQTKLTDGSLVIIKKQ